MGFEGGEGKAVDGVDFGVADVFGSYTFLELVADLGVEGLYEAQSVSSGSSVSVVVMRFSFSSSNIQLSSWSCLITSFAIESHCSFVIPVILTKLSFEC